MITWKPGTRFSVTADIAYQEIERIAETYGALKPEYVVEESKPEDAPLHDEFEWNDVRAAELYRIEQARHIIRSLVVVHDENKEPVRAYVLVTPKDNDTTYMRVDAALSDTEYREQVLERAQKELESWRKRYEALLDYATLLSISQKVLA